MKFKRKKYSNRISAKSVSHGVRKFNRMMEIASKESNINEGEAGLSLMALPIVIILLSLLGFAVMLGFIIVGFDISSSYYGDDLFWDVTISIFFYSGFYNVNYDTENRPKLDFWSTCYFFQ